MNGLTPEEAMDRIPLIEPCGDLLGEILKADQSGFDISVSAESFEPDTVAVVFRFDKMNLISFQTISPEEWKSGRIHVVVEDTQNYMLDGSNGICRLALLIHAEETYYYFQLLCPDEVKKMSMKRAFDRRENFYPTVKTFAEQGKSYAIIPFYAMSRQVSLMCRKEELVYAEQFANSLDEISIHNQCLNLTGTLCSLKIGRYIGFQLHYQGQENDEENYVIPFSEIREAGNGFLASAQYDISALDLNRAFWDLFCVVEVDGKSYLVKMFCANSRCKKRYQYIFGQPQYLYPYFISDNQSNAKRNALGHRYKDLVCLRIKNVHVKLHHQMLTIHFSGGFDAGEIHNMKIDNVHLFINNGNEYPVNLKLMQDKNQMEKVHLSIPAEKLVSQESKINNPLTFTLSINGVPVKYRLTKIEKRMKASRFYFVPMSGFYYKNYALFLRRNIAGTYYLVIREKADIEWDKSFLSLESELCSFIMYHMGKIKRKLHFRKINLFFEKDAAKADEGTWEIFDTVYQMSSSRNFFILDSSSPEWERRCMHDNVIAKYSSRYYRLLYSCDGLISTETSSHLNVHRALNHYVRKALLERPLIFLQHGVTYLKRQGNNSAFVKGNEGEPTYMIVGSRKEEDAVCEMLKIRPEQCIKAGLPIFSTITYEHITQDSDDIITIMPTWKPSEEYLINHFEDSTYFEKVETLYDLLKQYVSEEKIRIVPHPKVLPLLLKTRVGDRLYQGSVADALADTKLLVTDYSSVCYNVFYQGGGVLFFQPDLAEYEAEVGKLIPKAEEYIGWRTFSLSELETHIRTGIKNGIINLSYFRTEEFIRQYRQINEFCDGKNVERIVAFLKEKGFV